MPKKVHGFITDDETKKDIFLHVSALEESKLKYSRKIKDILRYKKEKNKLQQ